MIHQAADVRSGGFVLDGFPRTVEQATALDSVERAQGLETWTCGACGGDVRRRADDTAEAVTHRLTLYDEQTKPRLLGPGPADRDLLDGRQERAGRPRGHSPPGSP